ncbi:MAG: isoprenylcysteine carboxylmethyltransferase family protein [Planctomycetota bacterium]
MAVAWNRLRVLGSTFVAAVAVVLVFTSAKPELPKLWPPGVGDLGLLLVITGAGIRLWSSGYLDKGQRYDHISTGGPYRFVRHPLYVGNFLLTVGFGLLGFGFSLIAAALILAVVALHLPNILREEKKFVRVYGQEYVDYCNKVPRFVPRLWGQRPPADAGFRTRLITVNGEWFRLGLVGVLLGGIVIWGLVDSGM